VDAGCVEEVGVVVPAVVTEEGVTGKPAPGCVRNPVGVVVVCVVVVVARLVVVVARLVVVVPWLVVVVPWLVVVVAWSVVVAWAVVVVARFVVDVAWLVVVVADVGRVVDEGCGVEVAVAGLWECEIFACVPGVCTELADRRAPPLPPELFVAINAATKAAAARAAPATTIVLFLREPVWVSDWDATGSGAASAGSYGNTGGGGDVAAVADGTGLGGGATSS
jgi:hypothetical protein